MNARRFSMSMCVAATAVIAFGLTSPRAVGAEEADDEAVRFDADVHHRLDHLERRVRHDVADGSLPPSALDELASRWSRIDEQLARAKDDGEIDAFERRLVRSGLASMSAATDPSRATRGRGLREYERRHWNWENHW